MTSPGTRIGPYEIVAPLGRGGMGEVYRARDSRLQREVALKLLPSTLATDPEYLARSTREAQLLATINHPNIAAIYGVEESASGVVLVLELVEGPTLAERIAQGPLPQDEAVAIARQIAEALEFAHEQGIIHRDLKPANVKLRPDGTVKVLDFGLAKMAAPTSSATDIAMSPTFTAHATAVGVIMGTAAYMAPEQARGRAVDRRADIWAFGVVLFEMLTGVRPFGGETLSETLAAIIKDPPALEALAQTTPPALRALIARTLEKDPKRRLRDIGDARLILEDVQAGGSESMGTQAAAARPAVWKRALPWAVALAAGVAAVAFAVRTRESAKVDVPQIKFTLPITGESLERTALPAISSDGRHVVFSKNGHLWVRSLDALEARPLPGTNGAQFPFWSPDSREVAYLTATAIWRAGIDGSPPTQITTYRFSKGGRTPGGVWRPDGTIVFAPSATGSGILSVPAQGGEFTELYTRDPQTEGDFHRPSLLPDGRSIIFVVDRVDRGADTIGVLSDGKRKDVLTIKGDVIDSPVYSASGHILYHRETTNPGIWAVPFSVERLETTGTPFLVAPEGSYPSVSSNGTLVYADSSVSGVAGLAWLDIQSGKTESAYAEHLPGISYPRLSPDGRQAAFVAAAPGEGHLILVADLQRGTHVRLSDRADASSRPTWRDDKTIVFARNSAELNNQILMRAADGSGGETLITRGQQPFVAADRLVFPRVQAGTGGDLFHLSLPPGGQPGEAEPLQKLPQHEWWPALSPDGTLLTYTKGDVGQTEIVLRTFPTLTGQWQVSAGGGTYAAWNRAGDAIFYRNIPGEILRVAVSRTPTLTLGTPQVIPRPSDLLARVGFDVSPDGRRLLMVQEVRTDEQRTASLAVVQNWAAGFKR